jgi:hypothetical protein
VTRAPRATDCPDARALAAAVARIQGRDALDVNPASDAPVHIDVAFAHDGAAYSATITFRGARSGTRTIDGSANRCGGLTAAVAATLSLAVDDIASADPADAAQPPPPKEAPAPAPTLAAATPVPSPASEPDPGDVPEGLGDEARQHHRYYAPVPENGIFLELFGMSLNESLNYERFFGPDGRYSVRAGFDFTPKALDLLGALSTDRNADRFTFPLAGNYYLGRYSHRAQLGAGALFNIGPAANPVMPTLLTGYRYLRRPYGFEFGFTVTWMFAVGDLRIPVTYPFGLGSARLPTGFLPFFGLSFGTGF